MTIKEKIENLLEQLNTGIYEKEEVMALALLSSIAGESIFLLGPPGVAKSLIARRLKYAYKDAEVFEYLMSRFSTPDEIFGPVSIKKLKEDKYERITEKYLPSADVVFLDEIWKAGPSIQNALLTILNEKKFRNGENEIDVPMKALISASNELPVKAQGLEALWDRFLVRFVVGGIEDTEKFNEMISMSSAPFEDKIADKITADDYKKWSNEIDVITIPDNINNVIHVIRNKIELHNQNEENTEKQIYVSDRRWRKIMRLMRTSAFINDRKEIDLMDCFLIKHCIWNDEGQIDIVFQFVSEAIEKYGYTVSFDFENIKKELDEFKAEIEHETKFTKNVPIDVLEVIQNDYYEILNPPSQYDNLISKAEFNSLSNQNQVVYLHYWENSYQRVQNHSRYNTRKGNSKFNLFINDTEYQLKTTKQNKKRQETRKPNEYTEKAWDEKVYDFLLNTDDMKKQIEKYEEKDLKHIRTNLFVDPALANIVESHISETRKAIEKTELEIKEIQNGYKKLKDEEIVTQ